MNGLSLCSGIGGIDLGLKRAIPSYQTICYVEIEKYPQDILLARMADGVLDRAPIWGDLLSFDGTPWRGAVDVVVGGYPCQPFSTASHGKKVAASLWPEFLRIISECQPSLVLLENVLGSMQYVGETVRIDLEREGFCVHPPAIVAAACVGAPHIRRRVWLFAHADRGQEFSRAVDAEAPLMSADEGSWRDYSGALGMVDGLPHRVDRLKALGNAVVPAVVELAWRTLMREWTQ